MGKKVIRKTTKPALELKITYVDPNDLRLWEDNPRRNDEAAKRLIPLVQEHGFGVPVTVWCKNGVVYKGNTRVKTARLMGLARVPVIYRDYADEQAAITDAIADNRAHEWSEWDEDALAEQMRDRKGVSVEKLGRLTGFEKMEIEGLREGRNVDQQPLVDFTSQTFTEAVEQFEDQSPSAKEKEYWLWFILPGAVEMEAVREHLARGGSRELDVVKVARVLGIKLGPECTHCTGSGKSKDVDAGYNRRCPHCRGSGRKPLPVKVNAGVRPVRRK